MCKRAIFLIGSGKVSSVFMFGQSFDDRGELNVTATYRLEETIEFLRVPDIQVIDYRHCVPHHAVLVQEVDSAHHLIK